MKFFGKIFGGKSFVLLFGIAILFIVLIFSCGARIKNIEDRVPHADESEQAMVLKELKGEGVYRYDPLGSHGPTLYYFALPFVSKNFTISEARYSIGLFFLLGILLIFFAGLQNGLLTSIFSVSFFASSSLSQIYFSYFVHEGIFAILNLAMLILCWRAIRSGSLWAWICTGIVMGLMQATKETAILSYGSLFFAVLYSFFDDKDFYIKKYSSMREVLVLKGSGLIGFLVIFVIMYSSIGKNWGGILDAIYSYVHFFEKSQSIFHEKSFHYYFSLLLGKKSEGVFFGETILFGFGILGTVFAFIGKDSFQKYLSIFAWSNIVILSIIPYKTPWLILTAIVVLCINGGYACGVMLSDRNIFVRLFSLLLIAYGIFLQTKISLNASWRYHSDTKNIFLYVHSVKDIERLSKKIEIYKAVNGGNISVGIAMRESPWPLPWYLKDDKVGFWKNFDEISDPSRFHIIIVDKNQDIEKKFDENVWVEEYYGLRENLILTVFVKKEIFEKSL